MSGDQMKDNLTKSTLFGLAWQYTAFFSEAFLQLMVLAILARLLSPEDFGIVGLAMVIVGFAELFSQMGVGPALIQRSELTAVHIRVGFTISILLSLLLTLILIAASPWVAVFFRNDQITSVFSVISLNFFFSGFGVVAESLLKRDLQFKKLMWSRVGSYFFGYALIGITLAWLGYGVWTLVGATLGQSLLKSVMLLFLKPHPIIPSLSRREMRELLVFGGGFTLARFLNYSANQGDYFVVGRVMGPQALGVYSRAYQLMMLPAKYFGQVLSVVLFPVMAKLQDKREQLTKTYLIGIAMIALVSAPLGALMVTTAPEIVKVLLGPKWSETIIPFQILALGVLPRGVYKIDDALARALGAMYRRSVRDAIYATAVVLGTVIGLRWGLSGVAVGVLCAVTLNYILALRMSMKLLDCSWPEIIKALSPALYATIVVASVAMFVRYWLYAFFLPAWIILGVSALMSVASMVGLFLLQPQALGVYGTDTLKRFLPLLPVQRFPKTVSRWLLARFNI